MRMCVGECECVGECVWVHANVWVHACIRESIAADSFTRQKSTMVLQNC